MGFNWLLPQSFGLPCFYQNNVLKIEFCQQLSQQNVGVAIYSQLDSTQQGSLHVNLNLLLKQQITLKKMVAHAVQTENK